MIYDGKPFHSPHCSSVGNNLFSLFVFKIFLLSLAFSNLIMMRLGVGLLCLSCLGFIEIL